MIQTRDTLIHRELKITMLESALEVTVHLTLISYPLQGDLYSRHAQLVKAFIAKFLEINGLDPEVVEQQELSIVLPKMERNLNIPNQSHMDNLGVRCRTKRDSRDKTHHVQVVMLDQLHQPHPLFISGHYQVHQQEFHPDPLLLDSTLPCGAFSYLPQGQPIKEAKAPVYMNWKKVSHKKEYPDLLQGNSITRNGELKCTDKEVLQKQSGVLLDILKKVTQSIVEGRGIVGVSLPVRIFQPISTIERIVDWWAYCPRYLPQAAAAHSEKDMVGRMVQVVAYGFSGLHVSASQEKPFNPLLGETYQGSFPQDDTQICCEHTSHHPPITNFLLTNKKEGFRFYGSYEYQAQVSKTFNNINFYQKGNSQVEFQGGQSISWSLPFIKVSGLLTGDRTIRYHGLMTFIDKTNCIKALIKIGGNSEKKGGFMGFGGTQRQDIVVGKIYRYDPEYKTKKMGDKKAQDEQDWKMDDMVETLVELKGSWLENLWAGQEEVWNINSMRPSVHRPIENPLASDPRFREDLVWLSYRHQAQSEAWKLKLEERQRYERKLRKK